MVSPASRSWRGWGVVIRVASAAFLLTLVASACTGAGAGSEAVTSGADTAGSATGTAATVAGSWQQGLADGPNGPIPTIVIDQFGYRPAAQKIAVLRQPSTGYDVGSTYTPGEVIRVVDVGTNEAVLSGPAEPWAGGAQDSTSGDRVWWFDFSALSVPGTYRIEDAQAGLRSPDFVISDDVYDEVLTHAVRTFFYQRAGQDKAADTAGPAWADSASHIGPGQDADARPWEEKGREDLARDLQGGWYDAGDYNRYTAWHSSYLVTLLHAASENPDAVGDGTGIPESGNGVSDLLDEIAWGVAWLTRMQESDGSVLCVLGVDSASPPSAARGPSFYGPATTHATLSAAAAFAYAATVFESSGVPAFEGRSAALAERAERAWTWAQDNPSVTYFNNNNSLQPGSDGLAAGQQEVDDDGRARSKFEAAVYLFEIGGDPSLRAYIDEHHSAQISMDAPSQWTVTEQETLLHYAGLPGATNAVAKDIEAQYVAALETSARFLGATEAKADPYLAPLADYTWGSSRSKAAMGRMFALASAYAVPTPVAGAALDAAEGYIHYLHGVNPLGLVYLTTMQSAGAEHSARTLYHTWFAHGSRWEASTESSVGPPPGFVVGGPNPAYSIDACCADDPACFSSSNAQYCTMDLSPPLDQPPMKSYLQFNEGWPANSWEVTENSNSYQVEYIRLLATLVGGA